MATPAFSKQAEKDTILMLLSDAEIGKVSMAETLKSLATGDAYVDMNDLTAGVQIADERGVAHLSYVIPRSAVSAQTWEKIVAKMKKAN